MNYFPHIVILKFKNSTMNTEKYLLVFKDNFFNTIGTWVTKNENLKKIPYFTIIGFILIVQLTSCLPPLMTAISKNDTSKMESLIAGGARLNGDGIHVSPLYWAVNENKVEAVRILLNHGADVNKGNPSGTKNDWTPMHLAVKNGNTEIVKLLIDKGANLNLLNPLKQTPLMIAQENGSTIIINMLKNAENIKNNQFSEKDEKYSLTVDDKKENAAVVDNKVKPILSDADENVPVNSLSRTNTYALIIGNEDYSSFQTELSTEANVDFAINDAKIFKEYCNKTLGIPEKQIKLLTNATFGQMSQGLSWLSNLANVDNGKAELIFYYSGHGLPDETTKEPYIIPVDISGSNITQAIKLNDVYTKLTEHPALKVTAFIDACFSGGARNQSLMALKSVKIKPKESTLSGNIVVISSSTGDESSGVYKEKQHGYMTYFLLKKLKETKGDVTLNELGSYIIESVKKESALDGKIQTPQVLYSPVIEEQWKNWKLK